MTRIALAQYPIEYQAEWSTFERKIEGLVAEAADAGAKLLVFPEYGAMELASLLPAEWRKDVRRQLVELQAFLDGYLALHARLARRHQATIVASSFPVRVGERYRNRAYLATPDERLRFQEKLMMTRFEAEEWGISAGDAVRVFNTPVGRIGISICYDIEFPLIARRQAEAGAKLILTPSCTDTLAGHHRVHVGARARALESQAYVAVAPTVGSAPWSPAVDVNVGRAAIYSPPDRGLPDDGTLALGALDVPGWVMAEIDLEAVAAVRNDGQVLNDRDWPRHFAIAAPPAEIL
jgi:predicted amidohydrolase